MKVLKIRDAHYTESTGISELRAWSSQIRNKFGIVYSLFPKESLANDMFYIHAWAISNAYPC